MNYRAATLAALLASTAAPVALGQNYVTDNDADGVRATIIEAAPPAFPSNVTRSGQEGWVQLNFIVNDEGRAVDPIVVDSIGGYEFEAAALDAAKGWRFEPAPGGAEIGNNTIELRSELHRGRDAATSNFMRRYRRIVTHLVHEETEPAREMVNETIDLGGWNLYESTMLCLMAGRVEGQEGDLNDKLKFYRRAFEASNASALKGKDRRDVLRRIFEAEYELSQYGSATRTLEILEGERGSDTEVSLLQDRIDAMRATLDSDQDFRAQGQLATPCDCDEGTAVWQYVPARHEFSFANLDGAVERAEARCDSARSVFDIKDGGRHALPAGGENCRLFVFGDNRATFDLVEHASAAAGSAALSD